MRSFLTRVILVVLLRRVKSVCDTSTTAMVNEGNIGQTPTFSWLGVLRINLYSGGKSRLGATGLVLVTMQFALVNADDVVKIPSGVFTQSTRAMFLEATDTPWYCSPKGYTSHPEYEYKTTNTIALVELNLEDVNTYPLRPICWIDKVTSDTSSFLYAAGYTDENMLLEKVIYKIQYTEKPICDLFYNKSGQAKAMEKPVHYLCGFSKFHKTPCTWDNGMILVTNASKYFTLVGFGINGPGCAAPARFIDLQRYYKWAEQSTTQNNEMYDQYRRHNNKSVDFTLHRTIVEKSDRQQLGPKTNGSMEI